MTKTPTIVISRRKRTHEWGSARSWLGGNPRIGPLPWPRSRNGIPLFFMAQIDIKDINGAVMGRGEPISTPDGALAFFIGTDTEESAGAVLFVPREHIGAQVRPPPDARPAWSATGEIFPDKAEEGASRVFPFWPADLTAFDFPPFDEDDEEWGAAERAAVYNSFGKREYFLSAEHVYQQIGGSASNTIWHNAQHYAACLENALLHSSALVARKPALGEVAAEFGEHVARMRKWVAAMDPWEVMPPEEEEKLKEAFEKESTVFGSLFRFFTPHSLAALDTEWMIAAVSGSKRAYATLPEAARRLINASYLLPTHGWHQMFGHGVEIQGNAAADNEGNVMLLQLVYDDLMRWRFGDSGAFQFWIAPSDLRQGNWAAAHVTFESA